MDPCPNGTWTVLGDPVLACHVCPAGYACPTTSPASAAAAQVACALGTYSAGSAQSCTRCPAGFICPDPTNPNPIRCSNGTYCLAGVSVMTDCPAGYFCPKLAIFLWIHLCLQT